VAILSRAPWLKPGSALLRALRGAIDAAKGQTTGAECSERNKKRGGWGVVFVLIGARAAAGCVPCFH
jgi:hypothetical protein